VTGLTAALCALPPPTIRASAALCRCCCCCFCSAAGANGLSQERAYVTGLTAANLVYFSRHHLSVHCRHQPLLRLLLLLSLHCRRQWAEPGARLCDWPHSSQPCGGPLRWTKFLCIICSFVLLLPLCCSLHCRRCHFPAGAKDLSQEHAYVIGLTEGHCLHQLSLLLLFCASAVTFLQALTASARSGYCKVL
jgi:hypothetical protein